MSSNRRLRRPEPAHAGERRCRPQVEQLEDRTLLTGGPPPQWFLLTPSPMTATLALHIHPHLTISVDGVLATIPANVGRTADDNWLPLHTHDATGKIHVESPVAYDFNLGDFFFIWGKSFDAHSFLGLPLDAGHTLVMTVNGARSTAYGNLVLHDGDNIDLAYQTLPTAANLHYVNQVFHDLLHRDADAASQGTLGYALTLGRLSQAQVVQAVESSAEFHAVAVQALFQRYLHRSADATTVAGFLTFLHNGGTLEGAAAVIAGSDEYLKAHGGTAAGFLDALYQDALSRKADEAGKAYFTQALQTGMSRLQVARLIFGGDEFRQRELQGLYQQYLHRDVDAAGVAFWLQAWRLGLRTEQLVAALVASAEYAAKVA